MAHTIIYYIYIVSLLLYYYPLSVSYIHIVCQLVSYIHILLYAFHSPFYYPPSIWLAILKIIIYRFLAIAI